MTLISRLLRVRAVRGGAALLATAAVAFAGHYVWRGYQLCHPTRFRVTAEEANSAKQRLPSLTDLDVTAADGAVLKSWYVAPRNGVTIVVVPGLGGNRASLLDEGVLFTQHGYGVMLLEPRAHGDSGGSAATWGYLEADDVVRAVKVAYAQPGVSGVGALGFSVGASAVALAAARDPSIRAVVLHATWTTLQEEIDYKASHRGRLAAYFITKGYELSGVNVAAVSPLTELKHIGPRPLLLISGGVDADTPPDVMDRVFAACAKPSELWRLPNVGHGGYLKAAPRAYEQRVIGFWDNGFAKTYHAALGSVSPSP